MGELEAGSALKAMRTRSRCITRLPPERSGRVVEEQRKPAACSQAELALCPKIFFIKVHMRLNFSNSFAQGIR